MDSNPSSQATPSQPSGTQDIRIEDKLSEPNSFSSSSLFHEPSSYFSQTVAYGTNIIVPEAQKQIHAFLLHYTDTSGTQKYIEELKDMDLTENYSLNVDMCDVLKHDETLYKKIIDFPLEMIQIFDNVAKELFQTVCSGADESAVSKVIVRPFNLEKSHNIRDLKPTDIDRLVSIKGMITRCSQVIPDLSAAVMKCRLCGFRTTIPVINGNVAEPEKCQSCNGHYTMEIEHNYCSFADRQHIRLQETPESIPKGETPQSVSCVAFDELVDFANPGDRVIMTGVWRAVPARVNPRIRTSHSVFRTYLDVVHIQTFKNEIRIDKDFSKYKNDMSVYDKLRESFAPSIFGLEEVKNGLLAVLFGSSKSEQRDNINVLLVGDPSTAKSQLVQYIHKISPRGLYTSGKGSSAVGLTASVVRDPDTGEFILESGALVLSDRGICCIDEFDKMNDLARTVLHEAMEQQRVSIAKAGIVCSLNARCSIVACANPKDSAYNPKESVLKNIQLPPTLLSRFDLIYLILDTPDPARDAALARHIASLYTTHEKEVTPFSQEELKEYIRQAKEVNPVIPEALNQKIIDGYLEMRGVGRSQDVYSATTRQFMSAIRLSQAHARMRFADEVDENDVDFAFKLIQDGLLKSATDPTTGIVDMDLLTTGTSHEKRRIIADLCREITRMLEANHGNLNTNSILNNLKTAYNQNTNEEDMNEALFQLEAESAVFLTLENGRPTKATLHRAA